MAASESSEQRALVSHLDRCGVCYCAVPNGGLRSKKTAWKMVSEGAKKGVPDLLIFDPPPAKPACYGVALELKRSHGGRLSSAQKVWLDRLEARGWVPLVAEGCSEALKALRLLGYNV